MTEKPDYINETIRRLLNDAHDLERGADVDFSLVVQHLQEGALLLRTMNYRLTGLSAALDAWLTEQDGKIQ